MEHLSAAKIVVKPAERHCVCGQLKIQFTMKVKSLEEKRTLRFQVFQCSCVPFQSIARFFIHQAEGKCGKNYVKILNALGRDASFFPVLSWFHQNGAITAFYFLRPWWICFNLLLTHSYLYSTFYLYSDLQSWLFFKCLPDWKRFMFLDPRAAKRDASYRCCFSRTWFWRVIFSYFVSLYLVTREIVRQSRSFLGQKLGGEEDALKFVGLTASNKIW